MAFRFNFFEENANDDLVIDSEKRKPVNVSLQVDNEIPTGMISKDKVRELNCTSQQGVSFLEHKVPDGSIIRMVNGGELSQNDKIAQVTDVLPGQYEGGLKVWECSFDAIQHFGSIQPPKRLFDLGCGSGLVGIWALLKWPQCQVTFHDLNECVLENATIPNIQLNGVQVDRCDFMFGPWKSSFDLLNQKGKFDLISTADTLYDPENLGDLLFLILNLLEPKGGRAIVAAKRFYFGVGGGVASFMAHVNKQPDRIKARVIASFEDGASNIRDLLELTLV